MKKALLPLGLALGLLWPASAPAHERTCGDHGGDTCASDGSQDHGNTTNQEVGDAVYRTLCMVDNYLWPDGMEYDHAALYIGHFFEADGAGNWTHDDKVMHAMGQLAPCVGTSFFTNITDQNPAEETYWGAYMSMTADTREEREAIVATAFALASESDIGYSPLGAIDYKGFDWQATVSDIDDIRCDGVTEFSFESNGHWAWGKNGANFDITAGTANCDEHNDTPDLSQEPNLEASPKAQRGGWGDPHSYTVMVPSVAASPVVTPYVVSGTPGDRGYYLTDVQLELEGTDLSGVMSVSYWLASQPATEVKKYAERNFVTLTASNTVSYYAMDYAGNYPVYKDQVVIKIDKATPAVAITSPSGSPAQAVTSTITVSGMASDAGASGLYRVEAWSDTAAPMNYVFTASDPGPASGAWSIAGFPLQAGLNTVRVRSWDFAGNGSTESTVQVNLTPRRLTVSATPADGAWIAISRADAYGQAGGTTSFYRYYVGGSVSLTAPPIYGGNGFLRWEKDGVSQGSGVPTVDVDMSADHTGPAGRVDDRLDGGHLHLQHRRCQGRGARGPRHRIPV
jgi:hypothetical protein